MAETAANGVVPAAPLLELIDISKTYPSVQALDKVSLSLAPGEVLGLIGENGAGKSTLMKILGGVVSPTAGRLRLGGRERAALSVADAMAAGIAFVHQELNLFENLDVAGNIFIGREPLRGGPLRLIHRPRLYAQTRPLLARLGLDTGGEFGPETPLERLSLAQMQLVEIAKALSLNARVLILDEPTSSLTVTETDRLLTVIGELRDSGVGVIFISHRLQEIERCCDRVVVLRDGQQVATLHRQRDEIHHEQMIRLMIGRDLRALYIPPQTAPSEQGLKLSGFRSQAFPAQPVDLTVRRGEILGLAGLVGAGRTELARSLFGIDDAVGGEVSLDGQTVAIASPRDAIANGIFLIPEDRKRAGLLLDFSVAQNVSLPNLGAYARRGLIDAGEEVQAADTQRQRLSIKAPSALTVVGTLSGGNQQKVVLGKWLAMQPQAVIFDEPTRGIDVGAKSEIYRLMRGLADAGVAILMISSDMEEVIGVSDRIAVMHEGAISGILPSREQFSEHNVLQLAIGRGPAAAAG